MVPVDRLRLEQALVDAYIPAARAALEEFNLEAYASAAPVKEAASALASSRKPAPAKPPAPKPQRTGVRPRLLLLPCIVLCMMTAPIVGIYLPVYLSAFKATQDEANKRVVHCTIFPTPLEVDLAAIDKPMSPANQTIVDAYLQKLQADCPVVRNTDCRPCMNVRILPHAWSRSAPCRVRFSPAARCRRMPQWCMQARTGCA